MGATEAIARFIADTPATAVPAQAAENAKKAIADTFAAILAGAGSEVAGPMLHYAATCREPGPVSIIGTGLMVSPDTAALINATLGHALDFDDVLSMMPAHPSAVILPALLASLDGSRIDGQALIEAYVLGIEVGGKIGLGITGEHYRRGFHATGTLAIFSALAALARLHAMDVSLTRQAFGIAASMASGVRRNFGTMTKPLHSGLAARGALAAWRLATCGLSAAPDALEAPAGFFQAYGAPASDPEITVHGLGHPFIIVDPGLALKKFPCCYASHRAIDGLLALRMKLGFDVTDVESVVCSMPPGGMHVLTYPRPASGLEAKFSLDYPLAAVLLDGSCTLTSFTDDAVRRPQIDALYERIHAAEDPSCRGDDPQFEQQSSGSRGFVVVEVRLRDGRTGSIRVDKAPGAPVRELSWDDLHAKFADCARHGGRVASGTADEAFACIRNLEKLDDISRLVAMLR